MDDEVVQMEKSTEALWVTPTTKERFLGLKAHPKEPQDMVMTRLLDVWEEVKGESRKTDPTKNKLGVSDGQISKR